MLGYGMAMGFSGCDCFRASGKCADMLRSLDFTSEWSNIVRSAYMTVLGGDFDISYGSGIVI